MAEIHRERRADTRYAVTLAAEFTGPDRFDTHTLENLSRGGVFVQTAAPSSVGSMVSLNIVLPGVAAEIELQGRVTWVHDDVRHTERGVLGMGIQFVGLVPRSRALIEHHLRRLRAAILH